MTSLVSSDQRVKWLYRWQLLTGKSAPCLVQCPCIFCSQGYVFNLSYELMTGSSLQYVTTLISLVTISIAIMEMFLIHHLLVETPQLSHCLAIFGRHWSIASQGIIQKKSASVSRVLPFVRFDKQCSFCQKQCYFNTFLCYFKAFLG